MNTSLAVVHLLAYRSHGGGGFGSYLAHLLFRASVYRVMGVLPFPVVLVVGLVAGVVALRTFRSRSNR